MTSSGPGGHSKRGSHRLTQIAQCHRKWYLRWVRGLKPNKSPGYYLEGTLIHIALAYYRAHEMVEKLGKRAPTWYYLKSLDEALEEEGRGNPEAIKLARNVFNAYYQRYWAENDWETVSIEQEYEASLGQIRRLVKPSYAIGTNADDVEVFSTRIDLLYRANGFLWACDYKSTKHGNWRRGMQGTLATFNPEGEYAISFQFLLQTAILRINFGDEFRGVVVERILKAAPHDFDRALAPISRAMFLALPDTLAYLAHEEHQLGKDTLVQTGIAPSSDFESWLPRASPWSCYSGGTPCEYRPICLAENAGQLKETVVREYHTE